jgi:hypothetical protein
VDLQQLVQETLAKVAEVTKGQGAGMKKAIDLSTGLFGFNLQAPVKQLVPLMSPFYNSIPRKVRAGANSDNWKTITAISSPELFTAERAAGNTFTMTKVDKVAAYKVTAVRGEVTREAQAASLGFDDALAKETANTLYNAMKLSGQAYLYANITDVGVPGAPTLTEVNTPTGGGIAASAYFARIVALTGMAANRVNVDIPAAYGSIDGGGVGATSAYINGRAVPAGGVNALLTVAALSGTGVSSIGAEGTVTTAGGSDGLKITWTAVPGAVAYAVFVGLTTGAANLKCEAVVTQTSVTFLTLAATGIAGTAAEIPAADETGQVLAFDGILPQLLAGASGAYVKNLLGTLTGTAASAEVVEIQDAFASLWRTAKIGKFRLVMSGNDVRSLTKKGILSNAMQIFAGMGAEGRVNLTLGAHVGEILNAVTGDRCPVETEPWAIPGTIFILPMEIPYPDANVQNPFEWVGSYDWERWGYASTTSTGPIYPFETRSNGVLEGLFTGGCGLLYNVFQG